jgi:hypothetical protein
MEQLNSHWTDFDEISYSRLFRKPVEKTKVLLKFDKSNGTLLEDIFIFMTISCWFLLRMRNVLNKICRENKNTHFMSSDFFPKIVFMR